MANSENPPDEARSWEDYGAASPAAFLREWTDGDPETGGRRYRCGQCREEFRTVFALRLHWERYARHGGPLPPGQVVTLRFDAGGRLEAADRGGPP